MKIDETTAAALQPAEKMRYLSELAVFQDLSPREMADEAVAGSLRVCVRWLPSSRMRSVALARLNAPAAVSNQVVARSAVRSLPASNVSARSCASIAGEASSLISVSNGSAKGRISSVRPGSLTHLCQSRKLGRPHCHNRAGSVVSRLTGRQ